MSSRSKDLLNPILVAAYDAACKVYLELYPNMPQPFITCTYRSPEEQDQLFLQKPPVTKARGLESPHNYNPSPAFDIAFIATNKQLDWSSINFKNFADIIVEMEPKIEWGGAWVSFVDLPHLQLRNWKEYI